MNRLTKPFLIAHMFAFVAIEASGQQVRDLVLDDHLVYTVPVSAARVTTVSFPSPIAGIDGALTTMDGKTPGVFQVAHTKGTAYFSARALAKGAVTNLNVRWNNRTYVFELRESAEPCYSMILRSGGEKAGASSRPLTPNRLLGILDKVKAFPLLQQYQPEAVRDVEFRDCRATPLVSDCGEYEDGVAAWTRAGPQVTKLGPTVAGREVFDRRFIDLHVAAAEHAGADMFVNRPQPVGGQAHPLRHRLAREHHFVARGEDLFLPVERQVIDIFADDDRGDQAGGGEAAILQGAKRCDDRRGIGMIAPRVFAPHDAAFEEVRRLVVELLGHFLTNATPRIGAGFDRLGIDHFIEHRQMLGDARPALTRRRLARRAP
jgi:hypothetical protein